MQLGITMQWKAPVLWTNIIDFRRRIVRMSDFFKCCGNQIASEVLKMIYLQLRIRRWSWYTTHNFDLRCLLWWLIKYVCSFKSCRYQIWTAMFPWKCLGIYVHNNYSWILISQHHRISLSLISSRQNRKKTLNFYFVNLKMYITFFCFLFMFWGVTFNFLYWKRCILFADN